MSRRKDWYCYKCEFWIYGSKNKCLKCGTKKPQPKMNTDKQIIKYVFSLLVISAGIWFIYKKN